MNQDEPQMPSQGLQRNPPPQNLGAEAGLLGSILIDSDAITRVADMLTPDDFFDGRHQRIYAAMVSLYEKRSPIDVLTLTNQLQENSELDTVGGASYVTELANTVPTATNAENYAEIIKSKAVRRKLINTTQELASLGYDEGKPVQEIIEEAETKLFAVSQRQVEQNLSSLESILSESFERLDDLHKDSGKIRGVSTGFKDMDAVLAGLQKSDLLILAARPSMGKSAFSMNIAHNIAVNEKKAVLFFSLEMSKEQLVDRLLADEAEIDAWKIRTGNLTDEDFEKLGNAMGTLSEAPMFIDDTPGITVMEMRTKARREAHNQELGLIVVDYLQLMSGGSKFQGSDNRVQEISEISRGLKAIARELNVPVIALSQLSRSVEQRHPQIPQLSDLRESGSIEQDADVVMFIYREEYYNPETDRAHIADILIRKHRNGPTGNIELYFDREKQRISSLDTKHDQPFKD
jgi:replicative DNA helicase